MMSKKTLIAGLPFGGGKGVINGTPDEIRTPKLLKAYAQVVDSLGGRFYTGEDVGLQETDIQYMLTFSPYFVGKTGQAGDPSSFAAESAFQCLKVGLQEVFGATSCLGLKFAIKGVGKTGSALLEHIVSEGGQVVIADTDPRALLRILEKYPGIATGPVETIHTANVDVFVPCALGDDISETQANQIKARLVCGTANNQLTNMDVAVSLDRRGIVHIPDYIANAGGVINVADELMPGGYTVERVAQEIAKLPTVLEEIWSMAKQLHVDLDRATELRVAALLADTARSNVFV
jgi:glutamate dehydrogenase/leucine dehydrogenase